MGSVSSLLERPVYGMGQVDRILGIRSGTARRWIDGYKRGAKFYAPLIREHQTQSPLVTWGEFVETRLIFEYREQGVGVFKMRGVIERLREMYNTPYPLAHAKPFLDLQGLEIVHEAQEKAGVGGKLRFVIRSGQMLLPSASVKRFHDVTTFDEDAASRIRVQGAVILDPEYSFGEPTIEGRPLRAETLAEAIAAGTSLATVARMWEVEEAAVSDAVRWLSVA